MAKVMVSYSRHSEATARALAEDIQALGHTVWWDQELTGGQVWWDRILSTIRDCDVLVVVLDPDSLRSSACNREFQYAADLGKPVLPVLASDEVSMNLLPPALSQVQYVDYRVRDHVAGLRFARALGAIPASKPLPDPLPSPPGVPISYLGQLALKVGNQPSLSFEEQSALLLDFRRGLSDPTTSSDARQLLQVLRARPDVYATIAEEVDATLGPPKAMPTTPGHTGSTSPYRATPSLPVSPVEQTASFPRSPDRAGAAASRETQSGSPTGVEAARGPVQPPLTGSTASPTLRETILWAVILGCIGLAGGVISTYAFKWRTGELVDMYWITISTAGAAFAGVISGPRRTGIIGALVGVGTCTLLMFWLPTFACMAPLIAPLGAVLGGRLGNASLPKLPDDSGRSPARDAPKTGPETKD
jgi:hypothetical protein